MACTVQVIFVMSSVCLIRQTYLHTWVHIVLELCYLQDKSNSFQPTQQTDVKTKNSFNCKIPFPCSYFLFVELCLTPNDNQCKCYCQILILIKFLSHACCTRKHFRFYLRQRSRPIALSVMLLIAPALLCPFWLPCFCISTALFFDQVLCLS